MDLSSDDEGGSHQVSAVEEVKAGKRIIWGKNIFGRAKTNSATSVVYATSASPKPGTYPPYQDKLSYEQRALTRTRSDVVGLRCKDEWAEGILAQEGLQQSIAALRSSVAEYEREASTQEWKDLLKIHGDIQELGQLAESSQNKSSSKELEESADGLSKFTTVALEYSKLLDVVMNQTPEYAALAWGVIKFLLVAHVNHSKLKHNVQHYLIEFGQQFGIVNQLMTSLPTSKMVKAVAEAYAAFSKFLTKAVKYYRESKLMSAIKAFGFPWETRFQVLVNQINDAFRRIRELASAGHFGIAVQSQNMLRSISHDQQTLRLEMHQDSVDLRKHLKEELKDEVQSLFDSFDRNWIQRFEQIMQSAMPALEAAGSVAGALPAARFLSLPLPEAPNQATIPLHPPIAAIEYVDSIVAEKPPIDTNLALKHVTFLADHIGNPKRLRRFRDKSFPQLHCTDHDDARLRVRLKHLTPMDIQQCMGLLKHPSVKAWIESNNSSLLWVNTQRVYGIADWASSFATRIIEYAGKIDYLTVLYHFCGNHASSEKVSTIAVTVQSMIMQILQVHHKKFAARKAFPFTMEHFEDAAEDIEELWGLFMACIAEAELQCVWLILDNIDNLQKGPDWDFLVSALQQLTVEDSRLFKMFITARGTEKEATFGVTKALASMDAANPRVSIVTIPRAISRVTNALYAKSKRPSRRPDEKEPESITKADIDDLLASDSDGEPWEDKRDAESESHFVESPTPIKSMKVHYSSDDDLNLSDSSLNFMEDDPFASSAESDWEKQSNGLDLDMDDIDSEDDSDDFLSTTQKKKPLGKTSSGFTSSEDEESPRKAKEAYTRKLTKAGNGTRRSQPENSQATLKPSPPAISNPSERTGTFGTLESDDDDI